MEEQLISKKELLERTSISYGQLYRWKRKNLIPEEWFIRKSTFTGQETFFPREEILKRISMIQKMKENLSLDEMREMLSPKMKDVSMTADNCFIKVWFQGLLLKPIQKTEEVRFFHPAICFRCLCLRPAAVWKCQPCRSKNGCRGIKEA